MGEPLHTDHSIRLARGLSRTSPRLLLLVLLTLGWTASPGAVRAGPRSHAGATSAASLPDRIDASALRPASKRSLKRAFRTAGGARAAEASLTAVMEAVAALSGTREQAEAEPLHNLAWRLRQEENERLGGAPLLGFARRSTASARDASFDGVTVDLRFGPPLLTTRRDGSDVYTRLRLGRVSVDTLDQASAVLTKSVAYEQSPPADASYFEQATVASSFECCSDDWISDSGEALAADDRSYIKTFEGVRDRLLAAGYDVERIYSKQGKSLTAVADDVVPREYADGRRVPEELRTEDAWKGKARDIRAAFEDGRFLVIHRDHGGAGGWSNPSFQRSDVPRIADDSEPSVLFGINCTSGLFDNEMAERPTSVKPDESYFSERILRRETGGAVALIAATRVSYTTANDRLLDGLIDAIWPEDPQQEPLRRLADVLNQGKASLLGSYGANGITGSEFLLFGVLGDPSLPIWTAQPEALPDTATLDAKAAALVISYPVDGAVLTAWTDSARGAVPIGRSVVRDGKVRVPLPPRLLKGPALQELKKHLRLAASKPDAIGASRTLDWAD